MFIKYPHLERFGTDEVEGIDIGTCHIFPKLDGTNASLWYDGGIRAGSRNRELSLGNDNAGFYEWAHVNEDVASFFADNGDVYRLYGEWLVPHSLKTYREDAWRKLYIFDVWNDRECCWLTYDEYKFLLDPYNLDIIPAQSVVKNPTYDYLLGEAKRNTFLINDGQGNGEGIVIKQYGFKSKFGRTTWAKLVLNEFKELNAKAFGEKQHECRRVEQDIVDRFVTGALVDKTVAKIRLENGGNFSASCVPELLGQVWHEFVTENSWEMVKKFKNPTVDYKALNQLCISKVKEHKKELFGIGGA